jgi:hypothetical protein
MRGLAYRRDQWRRAKARAIRYLSWLWPDRIEWLAPRTVAHYAVDRVRCSCSRCGNPRRYTGEVTRQELRAACCCEAIGE